MKLTLDKVSRLVSSKALRDRFALKPGDSLEVTLEPEGIRLRPVQPPSPVAEEDEILVPALPSDPNQSLRHASALLRQPPR